MASAHGAILAAALFLIPVFANPTSRILGGEETSKDSFAYVASVRFDGAHVCGGTIIGTKSILTAAHCLQENEKNISVDRISVRVGSTNQFSGGKLYFVAESIIHPSYAGEKNDIAVLRLESPLQWTNRIQKIEIATNSIEDPKADEPVVVAGWGEQSSTTSSHKMHSMFLNVASDDDCLDAFSRKDNSSICLSHELKKGSCTGDAGNGAVYKNKIIGVSSFIVGACGSRYPEIFSKITHYASWLETVTV